MRKFIFKELVKARNDYHLQCPKDVWRWIELHPEEINFCGAKNGIKFPDKAYGIFFGWACAIHDGDFGYIRKQYIHNLKQGMVKEQALKILSLAVLDSNIRLMGNAVRIFWHEPNKGFFTTFRLFRAFWYLLGTLWKGKKTILDSIK
jgi:hypothetical protein